MSDEERRKGLKKLISKLEDMKEKGKFDHHFMRTVVLMEPDFDKVRGSQDAEENMISKIREVVNLRLAQDLGGRY